MPPSNSSYDIIPYEGHAFPETHPDRLATVSSLFGFKSAPVERCRVLELGCARGDNLIAMALTIPQASLVGVDLSARQIEEGNSAVKNLQLANMKLLHKDILEIKPDFGVFDYIVVHGIFSWVPKEVQEKILAVCSQNLAPNGVAYISYNTYPGWHSRGMVRDMMLYHCKKFGDPQKYVQQGRAFLDFIASAVAGADAPYSKIVKMELENIRHQPDWYLFHDYLEAVNDPIYFHQIAERAAKQGLQFLGEANVTQMLIQKFPPQVAETFNRLRGDVVQSEQLIDFLSNRMFRRSLFCRSDVAVDRTITPARVRQLYVACQLQPKSVPVDLAPGKVAEFRRAGQESCIRSGETLPKAIFAVLAQNWPSWIAVQKLVPAALELVRGRKVTQQEVSEAEMEAACQTLLRCVVEDLVELHAYPAPFSVSTAKLPRVSPLAREQARTLGRVTSLRMEEIQLDDPLKTILPLLDGSRDIEKLREMLTKSGSRSSVPVVRPATSSSATSYAGGDNASVEVLLERIRRNALFTP